MSKLKNTEMQDKFLEALFHPDVKGDTRKAMTLAGYSDTTATRDVVEPLQDQIVKLAQTQLAMNAGKAVFGLINVLDAPQGLGAKQAIAAAKEVLDRVGIIKKEDNGIKLPKGAIIFLPPKEDSIEITTPYRELELIDQEG